MERDLKRMDRGRMELDERKEGIWRKGNEENDVGGCKRNVELRKDGIRDWEEDENGRGRGDGKERIKRIEGYIYGKDNIRRMDGKNENERKERGIRYRRDEKKRGKKRRRKIKNIWKEDINKIWRKRNKRKYSEYGDGENERWKWGKKGNLDVNSEEINSKWGWLDRKKKRYFMIRNWEKDGN